MSTTIKRVALVAVAALGLGVVSVAPSTAAINADTFALSAATATQSTAETKTASSASISLSFLGAAGDSASVTAALVSGPTGNTALPYVALVETASALINHNGTRAVGYVTEPNNAVSVEAGAPAKVTTAKFAVYLGTDSLTAPVKAGTYVVKLTPASVGASGALLASTAQTLTITVTTAPTLDTVAVSADSILNLGETVSATADKTVAVSKEIPASSASTTSVATIKVTLKNAAGSTVSAESYTATITGPGLLGSGAFSGTNDNGATSVGRAITVKNTDVVGVFADGSAGVATITISSAAGVILATEKVTFFGDATKIVAATNALDAGSVGTIGSGAKLIKFNVYDAANVEINTGSYYAVTDSTSVANSTTYTACDASYDTTNGYFTCQVTGVAKGVANFYVTNRASATATTPATEVKSNSVAIRVGSKKAASVTVTPDKTSYAPGEKATITVALFDADGLAVSSGNYSSIFAAGGITASYTLGAGSDTTTAVDFSGDTYATIDGVYKYTVYMPVTEGDVKFSWKTGTATNADNVGLATANQAVAGSFTVSVSSAATAAAIDAAQEATAAAQDATDAALAAADAADAATTAAQNAVDAVADLSDKVDKLIKGLQSQIKSLSALVTKIAKKVKA